MNEPAVLVVDDDELFCEALVDYFAGLGVTATYATSYGQAVSEGLERFAVVVVDKHLPDGEGLELVDASSSSTGPSFIVVTGNPSYDHAVEAIRRRVVDYLAKPIELESLGEAVRRAIAPAQALASRVETAPLPQGLSETIQRYAASEIPILITGETGTGKSRLAREIHQASPRAHGPLVSINCASLPNALVDAELFGSRRGAFTGAIDRPGLFTLAHGGTLFLDEIGEIALASQVKLLEVLEEGRVRPLGGQTWQSVDVRLVAATHVDPEKAVAEGRFRADLLYRLDVGRVTLPPLREQTETLGIAVTSLLTELGAPPQARLVDGELARLAAHEWPGNFRELRNVLARALVLHPVHELRPSACLRRVEPPSETVGDVPQGDAESATLADIERRYVLHTLERHGGHRAGTARALGISEATLRRKLQSWEREGRSK